MTDPGKSSHRLSEDRPALASTVSQMNRTLFSLIGCHGQVSSDSSSHPAVDQETFPQGTQPPAAEGEQHENAEVLSSTIRLADDFPIQGAAPLLTSTSEGTDAHVASASRAADRASDQNSTPIQEESPPVAGKKQQDSGGGAGDVPKEKGNGDVQKDREKVVEEAEKEGEEKKKKTESSESHVKRVKEVKIEPEEPLSEKAVEVLTSLGELIAKANHLSSNDNVRQIIAFLFMGLLSSEEFVGCLRSRKDVENLSATAIEEKIVEIKKFLQKYTKELNLNEMKELLEAEEAFQKVTELFQRSSKDLGLGWIFVTSKEEEEALPPSQHRSPQATAPELARSTSIASLDGNESASEDGALADDVVEDKEQLLEPSDPVLHENEQVFPAENIGSEEVTTTEEKSPSDGSDDVAPSNDPIPVVSQEEEEGNGADTSDQQLTQLDPLVVKMFNAMMEERKKEPPLISSRKDSGGKLNITWVKTGTDPAQNESSGPPSSKGVYIVESNDNVTDGRDEWNRMFSDDEGSERGVNRVIEEAVEQGEGEVEKVAAKEAEEEEREELDDEVVQEETSGGEKVGGAVGGIQEEVGEEKENGGGEEEEAVRDAEEIGKEKGGEDEQAPRQVQKPERLGARVMTKKTYAYDETNDPLGLFARSEVKVIHPVYTLSESPYHAPFDEETATIPPDVRVKEEPSGEGDGHNVKMQKKELLQKKRKRSSTEDRHIQKAMSDGIRCPDAPSRFPRKAKERKSNNFVNEDNDIFGIFVRAPELVLPVYYLNETPPRSPCRDGVDGRDGDSVDRQPADGSQDNVIPVKEENPSEGVLDSVVSPFGNIMDSGEVALTDTQKRNSEDSRKSISPAEEGEKEAGDDCQEDDSAIVDEKEKPGGDSEGEQPADTPYAAIPSGDEDSKETVQRVIAILTDPRPLDDATFDKLLESISIPRQKSPSIITLSDDENDVKIVMSYVRFAAAQSVKIEEEDDQRGEGADSAGGEGAEAPVVAAEEAPKKKTKKKVRFSLPPKPAPKKPKPPIKLYDSRGNRFLSTEIQKRRQRKGSTWFVDTASVLAALSSDEEEEERERKKKKKVVEGKKKETKEEGEGRTGRRGILRKAAENDAVPVQTMKDKEAEEMKRKKQKKEIEMSKGKKKEGADVKEDPVKDKLLPSSSTEKEKESEKKEENTEKQGRKVNKEAEKEKDKPVAPMMRGRGRPPKRRALNSDEEDEERRPKRGKMEVSADEKTEPKRGRGRPRLSLAPPMPSTSSSSTNDSGNMSQKNVSPAPSSATTSQPSSSTSTKSPKPLSVDRPMAVDDMLMSDVLRIQKPVTLAPRRLSSGQFESRVALYFEPSLGSIKIPPIGMPYQLRPTDSVWPSIRCCAVLYVLSDEQHLKDKDLPDDIPHIFVFIENASAPRLDVPKDQKLPKDLEKLLMKMISKL